jgi:hypothetical protein
MEQKPRASGARAPDVQLGGERGNPTPERSQSQLVQLPRRILRKIVVEPTDGGWRAKIVGFSGQFWSGAASSVFRTRHMALEAAKAASRECGLPVVTIETIAPSDPDLAA